MSLSLGHLLVLFEYYKYILIFPVAVVEGPIISVISGFLVYLGFLNGFAIYIILVLGDVVGDSLHYFVGRYAGSMGWVKKLARFFGYNESSEKFLEEHFDKHMAKTFLFAKVSHGLGGAVQVAAGIAKVDYLQFVLWNFLGTLAKSFILMFIGFYAGSSYIKINSYLSSIAFITISIVVVLVTGYIILNKFAKRFFSDK